MKDIFNKINKAFSFADEEINGNNNNNGDGHNHDDNKEHERQNYLESKRQYEKHTKDIYIQNTQNRKGKYIAYQGERCTAEGCILECPYWPAVGYETDDGVIHYDDPNFEPEFLGIDNALETRRKVAAMTPEQYSKYRQNLELVHTYPDETKAAIAAGKRMFVSSGVYPPGQDPHDDPAAVPYKWKFNGDIYAV